MSKPQVSPCITACGMVQQPSPNGITRHRPVEFADSPAPRQKTGEGLVVEQIVSRRQRMIEARGHGLAQIVEAWSKQAGVSQPRVGMPEDLSVFREHAETVSSLMRSMRLSPVTTWRDLAILKICIQNWGLKNALGQGNQAGLAGDDPEVQRLREEIRREVILEETLLQAEMDLIEAQAFDRLLSSLPGTEREETEKIMKIDAFR